MPERGPDWMPIRGPVCAPFDRRQGMFAIASAGGGSDWASTRAGAVRQGLPIRWKAGRGAGQETSPAHGSSSAADLLSVPPIGGNATKQTGADGDAMINAEPSWS